MSLCEGKMDDEIRSKLDQILLQVNNRERSFAIFETELKTMSNDLTSMKAKMDLVLSQKDKVDELILTVNTLKTQFKIVWGVFGFGFITLGGFFLTAVVSGLVL